MDGFLSNNWRDALAVFGIVLTLIQSLVLLREWIAGRGKTSEVRVRFGYLEEVVDNPESSPEDKRVLRIAFAFSCGVVAVCTIADSLVPRGSGCFAEMIRLWAPAVTIFIALVHECSGLYVLTRYLSSKRTVQERGRLGLVLGVSLIILFILSCLIVGAHESYLGSWFSRMVLWYAVAYLFVFVLVTITEVVYQVDEWRRGKKKKRKLGLWER